MTKKKGTGIQPVRDLVLIRRIEEKEEEEKTAGGIIIPATAKKESTDMKQGEVVAVGEGERVDGELVPPPVKAGDKVLFSWGERIEIDEEEYYLVNSSNIKAILK